MSRWKPNAQERLREAALHLYGKRGFEQTTVAEIAERAGLTERTFFRYFADKREVLFAGSEQLEHTLVSALGSAPNSLSAIDAVASAFGTMATAFPVRREFSQRRSAIVNANPELQERERIKLASLAHALAAGLRDRGVHEAAAGIAAELGVTAFRIAFERWVSEPAQRDLAYYMREAFADLKQVAAGR